MSTVTFSLPHPTALVHPVPSAGRGRFFHAAWPLVMWLPSRTAEEPGKVLLPQLGPRRGHR